MASFCPTTLFVSDIHGEYEEFSHIVRSACGEVRRNIDAALGNALTEDEKDALATLIAYPREATAWQAAQASDQEEWAERTIDLLATLYDFVAGDDAACTLELADDATYAIEELAARVQNAFVKKLYVVGDVYDRGPSPDLAMDELCAFPELEILWGNHDILWMGAALGQRGCVATAVRICARYGNLSVLEQNYGIDLTPLRAFARTVYANDPCVAFAVKGNPDLSEAELEETARIQKAIAYLQFKIEAQLIDENPSFDLDDRKLLHRINYEQGTLDVDGVTYALKDTVFPTIDPADPYKLTPEESQLIDYLVEAFTGCEKLQQHVRLFLDKGSLYTIEGNNLIFHACVPLEADGSLKDVTLFGKTYHGRALFDAVDSYVRAAYLETDPQARKRGLDMLWYLWLGVGSPLFAKSKMATFEIYQIAEKAARTETKNAFYKHLENAQVLNNILAEFDVDPASGHIICGHVPVKVKDGESPIKCGGKALIIDGGMSKPYQATSGVAGFTLIEREGALTLATHEPFAGRQAAIEQNAQLVSTFATI